MGCFTFNITVNGKQTEYHTGYSRIGITENKTNGFHDLICGDNTIYRWSGEVYEEKRRGKAINFLQKNRKE